MGMLLPIALLVSVLGCKSSPQSIELNQPPKAELQYRQDKVDVTQLKFDLTVKPYQEAGYSGAIFVPSLDSADYLSLMICNESKTLCHKEILDGSSAEPRKNLPKGPLQISFKACVHPRRAMNSARLCSAEKQLVFTPS
jgi:hypothetical protein